MPGSTCREVPRALRLCAEVPAGEVPSTSQSRPETHQGVKTLLPLLTYFLSTYIFAFFFGALSPFSRSVLSLAPLEPFHSTHSLHPRRVSRRPAPVFSLPFLFFTPADAVFFLSLVFGLIYPRWAEITCDSLWNIDRAELCPTGALFESSPTPRRGDLAQHENSSSLGRSAGPVARHSGGLGYVDDGRIRSVPGGLRY